MVEARVVKLRTRVGYAKFQHADDKSPLKGAWSRSRDQFKFWDPNDISRTSETSDVKIYRPTQVGYIMLAYG